MTVFLARVFTNKSDAIDPELIAGTNHQETSALLAGTIGEEKPKKHKFIFPRKEKDPEDALPTYTFSSEA